MTPPTTPPAVHADRIDRLRREMHANAVDLVLLGPSSDLFYLTGFDAHLSERLNLLVVPSTGKPSLIVPVLEGPLVGEARHLVSVHSWADHEDAYDLAARVIGDIAGEHVAVGNQLWSAFLLRIQARVGAATWTEATPLLRELRMIKDDVEIALMTEVSHLTDDAWEAFISGSPISGLSERDALARLTELTAQRGIARIWGICASGPNAASPHHATGERVIAEGDAVIFDWGGSLRGYQSDVTRTVCVGAPSDEFRTVYDVVLRANQATLDAVRPGVPIEQLDRAARKLITEAGYGPAFIHRVGHGLGLDVHEEPYLIEGNDLPLAAGMVFSDEPGIYLDGKFGVRIEDTVLCTPDGGIRLNNATRKLTVLN